MGKIAILVNNKSIELIVPDQSKKLEFSTDVLQNQEITNSRKYTGLVTNFFNENNLVEEKVVILLSREILYEKKISSTSPEEEAKEIANFLNTIPFENKKISFLKIPKSETKEEIIIAVNKELYRFLLDVCVEMKLQVETVSPMQSLGEIDREAVIWKTIPPLLDKIDKNSPYNFLSEVQESDSQNNNKKYWIILFLSLFLFGTIFFGEFLLKYKEQLKNNNTGSSSDKLLTAPTPKQSSTSAEKSAEKSQLTIRVLNGTGTPGLAGEIKDQLLELGYPAAEIGNFEGTGSADTRISFNTAVSIDNQTEIINLLKKSFFKVSSESGQLQDVNVSIITGQKI